MNKKEVLEIRKQFTPANCAITRICGCYVDHEKNKKMQAIIARRGFTYRGKLAGNRVAYDIDLAEKSE